MMSTNTTDKNDSRASGRDTRYETTTRAFA